MTVPDYEAGYQASQALIESWGRRAQEQVERATAMQHAMERLSVTRWSPGREVRVTIDSAGLLQDVEFTEASRTRSAARLSRLLLTALHAATEDLRAGVAQVAAEHAGPDDLARTLVAEYDSALVAPLAAMRTNGASPTPDPTGPGPDPGTGTAPPSAPR